ncbi:MAG TPA: hypothetical protein VF426_03625 [Marmoricola sp.]
MRRRTLITAIAVLSALAITAPATGSDSGRTPATRRSVRAVATPAAVRTAGGGIKVYPVPTSSAGLERITTAPNGDMWFVEQDKNKVGRITPKGVFTEYTLPAQTSDGSRVMDLDVAADGRVWVVWDEGWQAISFTPAAPNSASNYSLGSSPYGESVRLGANGKTPWITMSFDEDGIAFLKNGHFFWPANAPECDGALARGRDGHMWCADFDKVVRVARDGKSGVTAALPDDATYPNSIAAGPNGAVWVGRDNQGTWFTYPGDGNIGWINSDTTSHFIKLGSKVAPRSLIRSGTDVWFTSIGGAKGIGHINQAGIGAITKVGNYHPTSLTIGKDGAIWFTDSDHNVIVRVPRSALQQTDLNLGDGSQLRPASATRRATLNKVKKGKKRVFKGTVTSTWSACRAGAIQVRRVKGHSSVVIARGRARSNGSYAIAIKKKRVKKGTYFTRVVQNTTRGTVCKVANSPRRTVR